MSPRRSCRVILAAWLLALPFAAPCAAQGSWGRSSLQLGRLPIGARAAGLAGAAATVPDDASALFANPAAIAAAGWSAAGTAEARPLDIAVGAIAATAPLGPVRVGLGVAYMDLGSVDEREPDPAYGGDRGAPTGSTVSAGEARAVLAAAVPLGAGVGLGAAVEYGALDIAGREESGVGGAVGASWRLGHYTAAAVARRPATAGFEAVLGSAFRLDGPGSSEVTARADLTRVVDAKAWLPAVGLELALTGPDVGAESTSLAARAGWSDRGDGEAGGIAVGGGIGFGRLRLDYAAEFFDPFGVVHRVGLSLR